MPESEGAQQPFFSPDGSRVGFFARAKLMTAAVAGGAPTPIADASASSLGGTWGDDDTIVYGPALSTGLLRVPSSGGKPQPVTQPDEAGRGYAHGRPHFLPGGTLACSSRRGVRPRSGGTWSCRSRPASGPRSPPGSGRPATPARATSCSRGRAASGPRRSTPTGRGPRAPRRSWSRRCTRRSPGPIPGSRSRTRARSPTCPAIPRWAGWPGSSGTAGRHPSPTPWCRSRTPASPPTARGSRSRIATTTSGRMDLRRGTRVRLTLDGEGSNAYPVWSRDGSRVLFASNRSGDWEI